MTMNLKPHNYHVTVTRNPNWHRPVVVTLAGLTFTLSDAAARAIADQLHDAAEDATHPRTDTRTNE